MVSEAYAKNTLSCFTVIYANSVDYNAFPFYRNFYYMRNISITLTR